MRPPPRTCQVDLAGGHHPPRAVERLTLRGAWDREKSPEWSGYAASA
jgi:hypothetical protein